MKKLIMLLVLLTGIILPCSLFAETPEVTEEWVARYNGPGNDYDYAYAIAVDSSGNVYVTGESWGGPDTSDDYATVKYDADGDEVWVARYNGPGNGHDHAIAIAVDSSGNVYVTGTSSLDYATVKYDADGDEVWVARYNGPGNDIDQAHAIAVDSSGNVYVTGPSWGSGTGFDYATIKYDAYGNEVWVARYNGPVNSFDHAYAIAIDSSDNVYVTGHSSGSGGSGIRYDYATVKYDAYGNEVWVARYNGPANDHDRAYAIAVDSSGNVYVTGHSIGSGTYDDYATIKYDADGDEVWVARYNGPADSDDYAIAIAVDSSDNVYVTGQSTGSGTAFDYATVKYDADGNQLWVARYNGPADSDDYGYAIAVDSSGNVYVTGRSSGNGTSFDYLTMKYSNTQPGTNVEVSDPASGTNLTFAEITTGGETTITVTDQGPPPQTDFRLQGNYYDITTTATFSGIITVCINYDDSGLTPEEENSLEICQYDEATELWPPITTISRDTDNNIICGETDRLSFFGVMYHVISATVDINPDTINLKSKGNWITCYIELPAAHNVNDIDVSKVTISQNTESVAAETSPTEVGDYDSDGTPDLMVKFDRQSLHQMLDLGSIELTVSGSLTSGLCFEGPDLVNVIDEGKEHIDEEDHSSVEY